MQQGQSRLSYSDVFGPALTLSWAGPVPCRSDRILNTSRLWSPRRHSLPRAIIFLRSQICGAAEIVLLSVQQKATLRGTALEKPAIARMQHTMGFAAGRRIWCAGIFTPKM
ncbi:hypothetical protein HRR83_003364 [Exophiala dermatitidis]|uniref:Uncharacterized protein n=1 Tax=Exophiala dermatitidis TaxID=5970 RepID=A0AAN6EV20_EXODE|nr:hypothetical protein HRR74_004478 [Exophiala dermatitidis]KAJ4521081.1 hypothetical protein HRR73_003422 [Exophiala dermatitidis]KAJ4547665.1 hypothetical protein HRR76_000296 [Exophiala dermatitidis]KAJ4553603.1 hypothetical protein HRR77_001984 [Exophiala dermatitidis]KAJ4577930.1 hypothetical protein HRR79_001254 [Exophiala dermatitidis]